MNSPNITGQSFTLCKLSFSENSPLRLYCYHFDRCHWWSPQLSMPLGLISYHYKVLGSWNLSSLGSFSANRYSIGLESVINNLVVFGYLFFNA